MSNNLVEKAKGLLADGKVLVLKASPESAEFAVQGSAPSPYIVSSAGIHWVCLCPARIEECAHIIACKLIYKSTARPKLFNSEKALDEIFARD